MSPNKSAVNKAVTPGCETVEMPLVHFPRSFWFTSVLLPTTRRSLESADIVLRSKPCTPIDPPLPPFPTTSAKLAGQITTNAPIGLTPTHDDVHIITLGPVECNHQLLFSPEFAVAKCHPLVTRLVPTKA